MTATVNARHDYKVTFTTTIARDDWIDKHHAHRIGTDTPGEYITDSPRGYLYVNGQRVQFIRDDLLAWPVDRLDAGRVTRFLGPRR